MELTFRKLLTCNFLNFQVAKGKHFPAPKFSNIKSASCRVLEFRNSEEASRFEKFEKIVDVPIFEIVEFFHTRAPIFPSCNVSSPSKTDKTED